MIFAKSYSLHRLNRPVAINLEFQLLLKLLYSGAKILTIALIKMDGQQHIKKYQHEIRIPIFEKLLRLNNSLA